MAASEDHASCWVHKDLTVTTTQIQALLTAARASGGKDECQVRLIGIEREYWMGTEIGRLGGYAFRGTVTADDGSNQKGMKTGAGYVNLRKQKKWQQRKVGREEEGSSSNRPELAAFVLASKVDVEQRGAEGEEMRKHRDRVTGAWKQISKQRRR